MIDQTKGPGSLKRLNLRLAWHCNCLKAKTPIIASLEQVWKAPQALSELARSKRPGAVLRTLSEMHSRQVEINELLERQRMQLAAETLRAGFICRIPLDSSIWLARDLLGSSQVSYLSCSQSWWLAVCIACTGHDDTVENLTQCGLLFGCNCSWVPQYPYVSFEPLTFAF